MGVIKRQSIKSTIVSYSGVALGYLNVAILYPYLLSTEQIGLIKVIMSSALLIIPFMTIGIGNVTVKFNPQFFNDQKRGLMQGLMIAVPVFGFLCMLLLFTIFKEQVFGYYQEKSPLFIENFYYVFPIAFLLMTFNVWAMYSRTLQRIVVPNVLREIILRLSILAGLVLFGLSMISFNGVLNVIAISYFIVTVLIIFYVHKQRALNVNFKFNPIDSRLRKQMSLFGLVTLLGGSSNMLIQNIDSLMLASMKDLNAVGVYSIAFFFATVIEMPKRSVSQITTPMIAGAWSRMDIPKLSEFYKKSANNQLIVGGLIFLVIWCNVDNIFAIIPNGEDFVAGKYVILFIGLAKLIVLGGGLSTEIIMNSKFYYLNLVGSIFLAVLIFLTNTWLIPMYGLNGAALASLISILCFNVYKFSVIYFKANITNLSFNLFKTGILIGIGVTIFTFLPTISNPFVDIIIRTGLIGIYGLIGIVLFKISPEINSVVNGVFERLGIKNRI